MNRYKRVITFTFILVFIIFIKINTITTFSATTTGELEMHDVISGDKNKPEDQNKAKDGSTELDGAIGDWDPRDDLSIKLNSLKETEIIGQRPTEGEYFTIAATVPINMEFGVYPNRVNGVMGAFYSPKYKVINHGSRELNVRVGFNKGAETDPEKTLFIAKPTRRNGKIEIDLELSYTKNKVEKKVDLTEDLTEKAEWKNLDGLSANEEAIITFKSNDWEPLKWEPEVRNTVTFSGMLIFEFSY